MSSFISTTSVMPGRSESSTSVILAHERNLVRESIAHMLSDAGFDVVGQASTLNDLRYLARQQSSDLILLDMEMVDHKADEIGGLATEFPHSAIVSLIGLQEASTTMRAMQGGAKGCLSLNLSSEEFFRGLRVIARGDVFVSREVAQHIRTKRSSASAAQKEVLHSLSNRELEVLTLITQGATNREIAEKLFITENSVKIHVRNILYKLKLRNRQQAAVYGALGGILNGNKSASDDGAASAEDEGLAKRPQNHPGRHYNGSENPYEFDITDSFFTSSKAS
jgi:DNA-binding NarL/FixJ family response regulator